MVDLRSDTTVYIEDIFYSASPWKEMHPFGEHANQLASREALRNLAIYHQRLLFEEPEYAKLKLVKPTAVINEATIDKSYLRCCFPRL